MKRFSRLIQPATAVVLTCALVGSILGFNYALHSRLKELNRSYRVEAADWNEYTGEVYQLMPDVALTVLAITALGIILAPESRSSDRRALRELARRKLSQSYLTEAELQQWTTILQETEGGDRHDA